MNNSSQEHIDRLIQEYINGALSTPEIDELKNLLESNSQAKQQYFEQLSIVKAHKLSAVAQNIDVDKNFERFSKSTSPTPLYKWIGIGSVTVITILVGLFFYIKSKGNEEKTPITPQTDSTISVVETTDSISFIENIDTQKSDTITIEKTQKTQYPDTLLFSKTKQFIQVNKKLAVFLNKHSSLQVIMKDTIELIVKGEAYIQSDKNFLLRTSQGLVLIDKGEYNINNLDKKDQTILNTFDKNRSIWINDKEVVLNKKKALSINTNKYNIEEYNVNFASWKTNKYKFEKAALENVIDLINRNYESNLELKSPVGCQFSGEFENESIDNIIKVLELTFDLSIDHDKNTTILTGNGCD